jgi:protein-S-isoprenylcysteine O-methyltransferase Ste14
MIFGWLPIFLLKKKGGVSRGKSYVHTTTLVTSGLYGIIRHPQYTAGILLSLALLLVSQHVIIILLGIIVIPLLYIDIIKADRSAIEKFGAAYREYMKRVPRSNFILGIIRRIRKP